MTDALTSKGFGDFEGERSENRLMMLRYKEVMSWLCIIDDSSPGRAVAELGSDALVSGKWFWKMVHSSFKVCVCD